ncbi:hypothetical protein LDC_1563 [sediment metagenome]|uniref:Uncharacterized protein n=1 Tax=sediment metagenome TaxID=749907 RepID=D9PJ54_9ZZZZ
MMILDNKDARYTQRPPAIKGTADNITALMNRSANEITARVDVLNDAFVLASEEDVWNLNFGLKIGRTG